MTFGIRVVAIGRRMRPTIPLSPEPSILGRPAEQPSAATDALRVDTHGRTTADHGRWVVGLDVRASGGTVSKGSCAATPSGVKCRTFRVRTVQP